MEIVELKQRSCVNNNFPGRRHRSGGRGCSKQIRVAIECWTVAILAPAISVEFPHSLASSFTIPPTQLQQDQDSHWYPPPPAVLAPAVRAGGGAVETSALD